MEPKAKCLSAWAIHFLLLVSLAPHRSEGSSNGDSSADTSRDIDSRQSDPELELLPPKPFSGYSDFVPTTPFGEGTVPFEIFNSTDPKYMRRSIVLQRPSEVRYHYHEC